MRAQVFLLTLVQFLFLANAHAFPLCRYIADQTQKLSPKPDDWIIPSSFVRQAGDLGAELELAFTPHVAASWITTTNGLVSGFLQEGEIIPRSLLDAYRRTRVARQFPDMNQCPWEQISYSLQVQLIQYFSARRISKNKESHGEFIQRKILGLRLKPWVPLRIRESARVMGKWLRPGTYWFPLGLFCNQGAVLFRTNRSRAQFAKDLGIEIHLRAPILPSQMLQTSRAILLGISGQSNWNEASIHLHLVHKLLGRTSERTPGRLFVEQFIRVELAYQLFDVVERGGTLSEVRDRPMGGLLFAPLWRPDLLMMLRYLMAGVPANDVKGYLGFRGHQHFERDVEGGLGDLDPIISNEVRLVDLKSGVLGNEEGRRIDRLDHILAEQPLISGKNAPLTDGEIQLTTALGAALDADAQNHRYMVNIYTQQEPLHGSWLLPHTFLYIPPEDQKLQSSEGGKLIYAMSLAEYRKFRATCDRHPEILWLYYPWKEFPFFVGNEELLRKIELSQQVARQRLKVEIEFLKKPGKSDAQQVQRLNSIMAEFAVQSGIYRTIFLSLGWKPQQ